MKDKEKRGIFKMSRAISEQEDNFERSNTCVTGVAKEEKKSKRKRKYICRNNGQSFSKIHKND